MDVLVQGRKAYAYTGGKPFDPALPTLVLIHGAANDHGAFTLLARWFAHHGWSVLAVDLPGHMRSAGPALTSIEAMADWLLELLAKVGAQRVALAGHSMGSLVALEAAARAHATTNPDRRATITHLVMLGTCNPMPVPQALLDLSQSDRAKAIQRVTNFSFSTLAAKPSYPGPGVWLRGSATALMHMVCRHAERVEGNPNLFHQDFSACNSYLGGERAAKALGAGEQPTLRATLILGRDDQMTLPRGAKQLATDLKARVHTVTAGHSLMAEAPDEVLNAMRQALTQG